MKTEIRPIGIIGAMDIEVAELKASLEQASIEKFAGIEFSCGKLLSQNVVIAECGVGKVNAARCAQIMYDRFNICALINTGVAGGVAKGLHVCDIVVATGLVEHDFDISALGGYSRSAIPGMGDKMSPSVFEADSKLSEVVFKAAVEAAGAEHIHRGLIATGDQFIAKAETKQWLSCEFNAYAAEMEGGAIAHVATLCDVPFAVIRAISDLADGSANISYEEFESKAADISVKTIMNTMRMLQAE